MIRVRCKCSMVCVASGASVGFVVVETRALAQRKLACHNQERFSTVESSWQSVLKM